MSQPLVLSLFPGIGLMDMAFEQEGFCVMRGPDVLWGGDIRRFHPPTGVFDGVIGGPPCQAFSPLRFLHAHSGHKIAENLIPEYERCVAEAHPTWFVMENVLDAPPPRIASYEVHSQVLNNRWLGEVQERTRRISFGSYMLRRPLLVEVALFECHEYASAVLASGGIAIDEHKRPARLRANQLGYKTQAYLDKAIRLQGLPDDFLAKAPFTVRDKIRVVGNGVPLPMGRAIARAVKRAMGYEMEPAA